MIPAANILTYFEMIPDPRTFRLKHRLIDVVAIAILSKVCGAEGWAPENLRVINLLVAKMLKAEKTCKKGIRGKQFKASLNHEYLCSILQAANF